MNQKDYMKSSLELHLFFDRVMKEHAFFLEASFTEKDIDMKRTASKFQIVFNDILETTINIANGNISKSLIETNEFITKNTLEAEIKASNLTGIQIDTEITKKQINLQSGEISVNNQLLEQVTSLNKQTLLALENFINFKNDILNQVLTCKIYTTNYPLLISHMIDEAKMYHHLLTKLETKEFNTINDIYNQELFWNDIMKEHAEFIRGLLDPSEKDLILTADRYANEYDLLIKNYRNNKNYLTEASVRETTNFQEFKMVGEEGILNCKIKSIINPLLADHVLREANHFLKILGNINKI